MLVHQRVATRIFPFDRWWPAERSSRWTGRRSERSERGLRGGPPQRCCFAVVHGCPYSFVCSELCASWKTNSVIYNENIYIYTHCLHDFYICKAYDMNRWYLSAQLFFFFPCAIRLIRSSLSSLTWHVQQDPPSTKVLLHSIWSLHSPG